MSGLILQQARMRRTGGLFLLLVFFLLLDCYGDAIEALADPNGSQFPLEVNGTVGDLNNTRNQTPPDVVSAVEEKKDKDQDGRSKEEGEKATEKNDQEKTKSKGNDTGSELKKVESVDSKMPQVKDSDEEECEPSNRCIDEKSKFVACLRVPGEDSLALSLLIQNKGTGSLDIDIEAPGFVNLEQNKVQLKAKEKKEVKLSVGDGANDTLINLKSGEGLCSLNLRNMISDDTRSSEASIWFGYSSPTKPASFVLIFLLAAVLIGTAWSCFKFRQIRQPEVGPRYQKVEAALPISNGGKKENDEADGWDNSWGDDWDDEEAPRTPSRIGLNPSSKGLASRRFSKDGWKD